MPAKAYANDNPPKLCACGHFLKGQMSVKRGWCGTCEKMKKEDERLSQEDIER